VGQIPEQVIGGDVYLLDVVDRVRLHDQAVIDQAAGPHLPAISTGQSQREQAELSGLLISEQQVLRVAAGGEADQAIDGARVHLHLAPEHVPHAQVVAHGAQHRHIHGQVERGQGGPTRRDRVQELDGQVRGVTARAAITHAQQLASGAKHAPERARRLDQRCRVVLEKCLRDGAALLRFLLHRLEQRGILRRFALPVPVQKGVQVSQVGVGHQSSSCRA
jgi:hypothetical protein